MRAGGRIIRGPRLAQPPRALSPIATLSAPLMASSRPADVGLSTVKLGLPATKKRAADELKALFAELARGRGPPVATAKTGARAAPGALAGAAGGRGRGREAGAWGEQLASGQVSPLEMASPRLASPPLMPRRSPALSSSWQDAWGNEEAGQGEGGEAEAGGTRVMTAMTDNLLTTGDNDTNYS